MQKKILIVEDGEFNRDLLIQLLSDDYEIVVADNGAQGIIKAFQENPDLILMDLGLPVMDGWEATKKIKEESDLKHIPVIAITSRAMVGDERRARAVGCDDYLAKPIDEDDLLDKIKRLI